MNDLRPLRVASNQTVSRLLLESALDDHSARGAKERALQALNLGAAATAAVVAVHAASTVPIASTSSGASHFAAAIVLKWLGIGLVGGVTTLVAADRVMLASSESRAASVAGPLSTERTVARRPALLPVSARALSEPEAVPSAAKAQQRVPALASQTVEPTAQAPEVGGSALDPLRELHTIRRALDGHAPARALALLDVFVARHPSSTLLEEAAVLRIDALSAAHDSAVRAEAQSFLSRYPRSAYAARVRLKLSAQP